MGMKASEGEMLGWIKINVLDDETKNKQEKHSVIDIRI